jgi:AcrR family transcriptional regulator
VADKSEASPRDRVLAAAMDIIVERGLDKLRLAEIGSRTKMSTGHVLYYFGTKDRILVETLTWAEAGVTVRRRREIAAAAPGWDQLDIFVEHYLPSDADDPVWALWVEMWAQRHSDEQHTAALRETAREWRLDLEALLDRGRRAGAFSGGAGTFADRLAALMNGFAVQIMERTRDLEEVTSLVLEQCRLELTPGGRA